MTLGDALSKIERRLTKFVTLRSIAMHNPRPIVSFSFDDFPKSAVDNGARLLDQHGVTGTFFFCRCFADKTVNGVEYFHTEDLHALIDRGHEIGCHTASHIHLPYFSDADISHDLDANASYIAEHLDDYVLSTFAYPFGDANFRTKRLAQNRYAACRSAHEGVNAGVADLAALRASRLYSARIDTAKLRDLIQGAARKNGWLNLYTHDVDENPSPFGCTPALLNDAVAIARQEGCDILTVKNALGAIAFGT